MLRCLLLVFITLVCTANVTPISGQRHAKTLVVDNGGSWGTWGYEDFCGSGLYAVGYKMKIEERQGRGDDTALNGIKLICGTRSGISDGSFATSKVGLWGDWLGEVRCNGGQVMSAFALQVEEWQRNGDDTAANSMMIRCRNFATSGPETERYMGVDGLGYWGRYGRWSQSCNADSAVCGIRTRVEDYQGRGDDTALNDVEFICCT